MASSISSEANIDTKAKVRRAGVAAQLYGAWHNALSAQASSTAREQRDTLVLLLAVATIALPHGGHLPIWASVSLVILWTWRFILTLRRRPPPGRLLMLPLLLAIAVGVWLEHGTLLGREAGVSFLLLLMGLKLLEMRARRDVFVVVFLAFFILLTQFLFGQGLLLAAVALATVAALFFVLISVHLSDGDLPAGHKLRLVLSLLMKALPLAIVLFVLFPRLSGPLWGLPGESTTSTSGLSNSMAPGNISQLLESEAIALRAQFDGPAPSRALLYWRGPVFGAFDGKTWSPLERYLEGAAPAATVKLDAGSAVSYTVTLEPHRRDWLFALEMASLPEAAASQPLQARYTPDFLIVAENSINERVRYRATSFTRFAMAADATDITLANWLQLPPGYNPLTLQFASALKNRVVPGGLQRHDGDRALVNAVLNHFRQEGFAYTLTPPLLGRNGVDDFLFKTRQGYCEHYASAFVVLMRALDVPARVVTGYQGGEIHPVDGYMTIRQSDAHAWAEVWLKDSGWVRVDPTAVVAPLRIDRGADAILRQSGLVPLSDRVAPLAWMRTLRLNWEALNNSWNQWVLSYSAQRQRELLSALGLTPSMETLAVVLGISVSVVLGVLAVWSLRYRQRRDSFAELTAQLHQRLLAAGVKVTPVDGLRTTATVVRHQLAPMSQAQVLPILDWLEQVRYGQGSPSSTDHRVAKQLRAMRQRVRKIGPLVRS